MLSRKVKTIRALDRGLDVLRALQLSDGLSLHQLHQETGLAKATLTRILVTLGKRGIIWQRMADGAYLSSHTLYDAASSANHLRRLVEISSPLLEAMGQRIAWPSVLAVPRPDHMEVIETNGPHTYFDHVPLGPIGYRINMVQSATGRAYLAFCGASEREAILERIQFASYGPPTRTLLDRTLKKAREAGYATREPKITGLSNSAYGAEEDGRHSVAVPVTVNGEPIGCLNVTWTARVASIPVFVKRHLKDLQTTAAEIGHRFSVSNDSLQPRIEN